MGLKRRSRIPTDLDILETIHARHQADFAGFDPDAPDRSAKMYVPIAVKEISERLRVDPDSVFGRLYYDLNHRYEYKKDDGSKVPFFTLKAGDDRHCVNFPYLESVLATLRAEDRKYRIATTVAIVSLFISVISVALSIIV